MATITTRSIAMSNTQPSVGRHVGETPIEYTVETITPQVAADFLSVLTPRQRALSTAKVKDYARLMKEGKWFEGRTGQPLGFDTDGYLVQGQHRLQAVIMSGVTLRMEVAWGLPVDAFEYMDQGFRRGAQQFIGKNGTLKSAGLRQIRYLIGIASDRSQHGTDDRATMPEVLATYEDWKDVVDPLCGPVHRAYVHTNVRESALLAVLAVAARTRYADRVTGFLDGVIDGSGLERTDPRLQLRNRFASRNHKIGLAEALAYVIKAWNAYATEKPMAVLRFGRSEELPTIVGWR